MYAEELTDAFVKQMIDEGPQAVILTGDLTFNGARESHERLTEKLGLLEDNGIPVYVIPGNHDLNNTSAARFSGEHYEFVDSITSIEFEQMYHRFGFEEALEKDKTTLSYTADLSDNVRLLMVDANSTLCPGGISDETLDWIEKQLIRAKDDGVHVIACSHQNLLSHTDLFSYGFTMGNGEELRKLYEQYHVICNFSGHMHLQHIEEENGITDIATSSLAITPNQYGVIQIYDDALNYETKPVNVAAYNPELKDFLKISQEFFLANSIRKIEKQVKNEEDIAFFADVNIKYFTGHTNNIDWSKAPSYDKETFWGKYMDSIRNEEERDHNRLTVELK